MASEIVLAYPLTFDGLAAAVAAHRLRPGSAVMLPGQLPGRIGEFAALHGEACGLAPGDLAIDTVTRVWQVSGAKPPMPRGIPPGALLGTIAGTGAGTALATGYVLALAGQEAPVSPMEATLFYLGILEGTGGYPDEADAQALAYCVKAGARRDIAGSYLGAQGTASTLAGPVLPVGPGAEAPALLALSALDLMNSPVQSVGPDTPIAEAHGLLLRTGHGALPVAIGDRPVGMLLRIDLERAVRHGLGDRPVREAMSPDPPVVAPRTAVAEIVPHLIGPGAGRVLVVEGERLVGIIARSDVLAKLYDRSAVAEGPHAVSLDAGPLLEARWAPDQLALLRRVSRAAAGRKVYLVGGAVRDLLLERPSYDLDLMVEADGQELARLLARDMDAHVSVHVPFGTATITLEDGQRIDVATSRAELYVRPGALPDVAPAGLEHDLARRDFTVNALAMRVDPAAWGRVLDPFGGIADLRARKLRILHNLSFVEDPTRLVRGIRFERTLGMHLEPVTDGFARYAMATGRLDGLGGERLKWELRKLLALPGVAASAARVAQLDGWRLLHARLAGRPVPDEALDRLEDLVSDWPDLKAEERATARYRGVLAILLAPLGPDGVREALASLHSSADAAHAVMQAVTAGQELLPGAATWATGKPSERFFRLKGLGLDALRHLAAVSPDPAVRAAVADHLSQRSIKLSGVDGDWLKAQGLRPGPVFGRILADTLAAVLDGQIAGPEAERAFALARARELRGAFEGRLS